MSTETSWVKGRRIPTSPQMMRALMDAGFVGFGDVDLRDAVLDHPVHTYFVLDELAQRLKIGISTNIPRRVRDLQRGCGGALRLLHMLPTNEEKRWHTRLHAYRLHGEWFQYGPDVKAILLKFFPLGEATP